MSEDPRSNLTRQYFNRKVVTIAAIAVGIFSIGFLVASVESKANSLARTADLTCGVPSGWTSLVEELQIQKISVGGLWKCAPQFSVEGPFPNREDVIADTQIMTKDMILNSDRIIASLSQRTCLSKEREFDKVQIVMTKLGRSFLVTVEFSSNEEQEIATTWLESVSFQGIELFDGGTIPLLMDQVGQRRR